MKQINCCVNSSDYLNFQKMFPQCLSRFVRNCVHLAVSDKLFFQKIFFMECK